MAGRWEPSDLDTAHRHCIRNRAEIHRSRTCGCFCCFATFPPTEIAEWALDWVEEGPLACRDQKPVTATCPRCGTDAVLGDESGYAVGNPAFLAAMRERWFGTAS